MEQLVQCPVCTLYLHNGMSLESHLDTHPKDQVIKALCSLSVPKSNYSSRSTTPLQSERSYRSRSRTPAIDENGTRWTSHTNSEQDRYWRRTPNRTPNRTSSRTSKSTNNTRTGTPNDLRMNDINFDANLNSNQPNSIFPFQVKSDKCTSFSAGPESDYDSPYSYAQDQQEEPEIKYSRSTEYSAPNSTCSSVFAYNLQNPSPGVRLQTALLSTPKRNADYPSMLANHRSNEFIIPKTNNIALVKTNMGSLQYLPNVKPVAVMLPSQAFIPKTSHQNNLIVAGNITNSSHTVQNKLSASVIPNQFNQLPGAFTPTKTVVTQNSQIIYREMVHNIEGKPFISGVPTVIGSQENIANVTQTSSLYQNVMVVDPFGNASCIYTPQTMIPQTSVSSFSQTPTTLNVNADKSSEKDDSNKTFVIEVGPITSDSTENISVTVSNESKTSGKDLNNDNDLERPESQASMKKGLKILSNIKVEVPVQHHKSMLNTVVDLTGPVEREYSTTDSFDNNSNEFDSRRDSCSRNVIQVSASQNVSTNAFSVIKNVGKPPGYKEKKKATSSIVRVVDTESTDSCSTPDLTCNEKASISPCSELSENGDNSVDNVPILMKANLQISKKQADQFSEKTQEQQPIKRTYRNTLRLNNVYVKKNKKILKIKNAKSTPSTSTKPIDRATSSNLSEVIIPKEENKRDDEQPFCAEKNYDASREYDVNTEEQSMDIEPVAHTSFHQTNVVVDITHVKEEGNSSNEMFPSDMNMSEREMPPLELMRPINVIAYNNIPEENFDDDSNHRELLDLETSKSKQFVNMMSDNYFGDNIYADYFTPDRVESFDTVRETVVFSKDLSKSDEHAGYLWENGQKNNFVLPNFMHDNNLGSYQMSTNCVLDESDLAQERDGDACEQDSKIDLLSESHSSDVALDICADEKMPPRGELSGQESNGDMDAPWNGMYPENTPEPYDLLAREAWNSDGSDLDANEKQDDLEDDLTSKPIYRYSCSICSSRFMWLKEFHAHRALAHPSLPSKTSYNKLLTTKVIKKEEKIDDPITSIIVTETKTHFTSKIEATVYDEIKEAKPKIPKIRIKKESRRKRDYVCPTCKVDQGSEALLREHAKIHPLECLTCGKCFHRQANLSLHMRIHLGIKNHKCEICEKRFITRQKLQEHINTHTGRAPIKCTLCDESFRRYSNMVQHRDRHHLNKRPKVRDFVCQCGEVFHSRAKLRWHRETHDGRPKSCHYCSDKFVHAASLTRHVRRSHNSYYVPEGRRVTNQMENVTCPVCKQVYLRANLKAHLSTHTGKRPYVCVICNKSFTTKWNLKLHRWVHMSRSAKPYKCTLCKGAFIRQSEYISHMNAHRSVRPYTCNYCGCQFIRKYNCQRHVREHELAKKYVCKVPDCGKSFHRSYYLTEHMRVHSGARPFSCNICGKTSSNKSNHNKHVKIHHSREPVATES